MTIKKPFLLAILDGWGAGPACGGNAISAASTPVFDSLLVSYPSTTLGASGECVGLPPGQMGNSEVGHLNIGAGRLVLQDFLRINSSIERGSFFRNEVLKSAIDRASEQGSTLHLLGLLSDGGVHSHIEHLLALLEMAKEAGLARVATHAFLDGRDVAPRSALEYVREIQARTSPGAGAIRTIAGRYYAMDRDRRWDRTRLAYDAIVKGEGPRARSAEAAVLESYEDGVDDEFLVPRVVCEPEPMGPHDTVIFFNFRPDRPRQLTEALVEREFTGFDRGEDPRLPYMVTMTEYDPRFGLPMAFPPEEVRYVLADVLAENGLRQLHLAETEKYAHVTYFFNGGIEEPKPGEERVLIPSPDVTTYDLQPEMSASEVADETIRRIESDVYDFIVMNFANGDMVGHTGFFEAAIKAVEAVDANLGRVLSALRSAGGGAFVTSDHGNADEMGEAGSPCTAHSLARVPFIDVTGAMMGLRDDGTLGDVAPTVLEAMGLPQPAEMTGRTLYTQVANTRPEP